jgi:hypothetical protein
VIRRTIIRLLAVSLCISAGLFGQTTLKRGRNEGTMNIPATNVIGNGNVTVYAGGSGSYGVVSGASGDPAFGICVGIANILQISGKIAFADFRGLGTSEAHLQITTPGNDRLRFFGGALCGDLYLTTAADTISVSATAGKPEYNSFMLPSVILDFDWLALFKTFPLKTYLAVGMADEPDQLYRYQQISAKAGIEWKMYESCGFLDIGAGLYKEKGNGAFAGDLGYIQRTVWFEPGVRYRFYGAYSLLGSLRFTAYEAIKENNPLPVPFVRASAVMDIPLLFKETNTEAIRTLVFMERKKELKKDTITRNMEQGKSADNGLEKELRSLDMNSEVPDADQEKEAVRKREAIQQKLDDLEKLLDETQ